LIHFYNKIVRCAKEHIMTMKHYITNIWNALLGKNPYLSELEKIRLDCEQKASSEATGYQVLIENLRERLKTAAEDVASANKYIGKLLQEKNELEMRLRHATE